MIIIHLVNALSIDIEEQVLTKGSRFDCNMSSSSIQHIIAHCQDTCLRAKDPQRLFLSQGDNKSSTYTPSAEGQRPNSTSEKDAEGRQTYDDSCNIHGKGKSMNTYAVLTRRSMKLYTEIY